MHPMTRPSSFSAATLRRVAPMIRYGVIGGLILTTTGCVSKSTYDSARQEAKERAQESAQVQADIQRLEQQRDALESDHQKETRTVATLKMQVQQIRASLDEVQKETRAKLAGLQHNLAALKAKQQAMLKEIAETKRNEKRVEILTAQREREMTQSSPAEDAKVAPMSQAAPESPSEPRMVAVITPQAESTAAPTPSQAPQTPQPPANKPPLSELTTPSEVSAPKPVVSQPTPVVQPPTPLTNQAKPAPTTVAASAPAPTPPAAPQDDSWLASVTTWFTSLFGWIWS